MSTKGGLKEIRCGRLRQDGSRCRQGFGKCWPSLVTEGTMELSYTGTLEGRPRVYGSTGKPVLPLIGSKRWTAECTKRCGASYPVKEETLLRLYREAEAEDRDTIWLADVTLSRSA